MFLYNREKFCQLIDGDFNEDILIVDWTLRNLSTSRSIFHLVTMPGLLLDDFAGPNLVKS